MTVSRPSLRKEAVPAGVVSDMADADRAGSAAALPEHGRVLFVVEAGCARGEYTVAVPCEPVLLCATTITDDAHAALRCDDPEAIPRGRKRVEHRHRRGSAQLDAFKVRCCPRGLHLGPHHH